jgi:hypothetical protein
MLTSLRCFDRACSPATREALSIPSLLGRKDFSIAMQWTVRLLFLIVSKAFTPDSIDFSSLQERLQAGLSSTSRVNFAPYEMVLVRRL